MEQSIFPSFFQSFTKARAHTHTQPFVIRFVLLFSLDCATFFPYPPENAYACVIHLPAYAWISQWPGKLRLFAPKSVRFLREGSCVFVFARLWLCLFRQVLHVESLCVRLRVYACIWQRNLCHEPIFIPSFKENCAFQQRAFILPNQQRTHTHTLTQTHLQWMNEHWASKQASECVCVYAFYLYRCAYLYSLVRFSVFTFVTLWPRAYLSLHKWRVRISYSLEYACVCVRQAHTKKHIQTHHTYRLHLSRCHISMLYDGTMVIEPTEAFANAQDICEHSKQLWKLKNPKKGERRVNEHGMNEAYTGISGARPENSIALRNLNEN